MIGEALRLIRVYHDVKLIDLAEEFSVSPSFLSEIENQKKTPNIELVEKYAKYFKIRPSAIYFFAEEIDQSKITGKIKSNIRKNMISFMQLLEKYKDLEQT